MKTRNTRFLAGVFFGLTSLLTGCNETLPITNGELPDAVLPHVQTYLGTYHGILDEERDTTFTLTLDGKKPVLTIVDGFIADSCMFTIGDLVSVKVNKKSRELKSATFTFDPNFCKYLLAGRDITLKFKKMDSPQDAQIKFQVVKSVETSTLCSSGGDYYTPHNPYVPPGPYGPHWPYYRQECSTFDHPIYMSGIFNKVEAIPSPN